MLRIAFLLWLAFAVIGVAGCLFHQKSTWKPPEYAKPAPRKSLRQFPEQDGPAVDLPSMATCFKPVGNPEQVAERALGFAEREYKIAVDGEKRRCPDCVGRFYRAAGFAFIRRQSSGARERSADWLRADAIYSSALARLIETGQRFGFLDPHLGLTLPSADGPGLVPILHRIEPWQSDDIDEFAVVGKYKNESLRVTYSSDGIGVPLVGFCNEKPGVANKQRFLAKKHPITLSAILVPDLQLVREVQTEAAYDDQTANWQSGIMLVNTTRYSQVTIGDHAEEIRRDLTAPLAYPLEQESRIDLAWLGFRQPELAEGFAGLFLLEPYQPGKIPVVFVHGLLSSPSTWSDMINGLRAHDDLTKRYQFAVFRYPTGVAFVVTAAQLRQELEQFHRTVNPDGSDPNVNNMVLVGHSMGGLLVRLQISGSGNAFWSEISNYPPDELNMSPKTRAAVDRLLFFEPRPDVGRAVFIATPHRGASASRRLIGAIGSMLVRRPEELHEARRELVQLNRDRINRRNFAIRGESSIDELNPKSPVMTALQETQFAPGVPLHTILGTSNGIPGMHVGDGLVSISSATLDQAESTLEVKAEHVEAHRQPESIAEVIRILRLHLSNTPVTVP